MAKETLVLLYDGHSAKRGVSVLSAESVMRAINYDKFFMRTYFIAQSGDFIKAQGFSSKPVDDEKLMTNATVAGSRKIKPSDIYEEGAVAFLVLHGPMGGDSSIQGFLEVLRMPYVRTNILSSGVATDRISTRHALESAGVPLIAYVTYVEGADLKKAVARVNEKLAYPVSVGLTSMELSIGISKADDEKELRSAINLVLKYDDRILVETGANAREIEVGILGNADVQTALSGEIIKNVALYDYGAKYIDNKITMDIPAHTDSSIMEEIRGYVTTTFRAIGGRGSSRCNFFLTEDGCVYLNKLSTMSGFIQWSMYPLLWENVGLAYSDLIEKLVELAKEMSERRESHLT